MANGYTYELRLKDMMSSGFAKAAQKSAEFYNKITAGQRKYLAQSKKIPQSIGQLEKHLGRLKHKRDRANSVKRIIQYNRQLKQTERQLRRLQNQPPASFFSRLRNASGLLRSFGGAFAAYFGISAAINLARNSLEKFDIQAKSDAQLRSALISTNYTAGRSFADLASQADALQGKTLFGDEATQEIQAMMLTFKNVKTEMYDQSIPTILDLATAMKIDGKSAAIQLGKALNDPAANLSALSRNGIQFTEVQKKQIKHFQATNQLAQAQAIILQEVNSQFGGSAEAAAQSGEGAWQMFMNTVGDKMETFGGWLSGLKTSVALFFMSFFDQMQPLIDAWNYLGEAISPLFTAIGSFLGAMGFVSEGTDAAGAAVGGLAGIINVLAGIIDFVVKGITGLLAILEPIAPLIKYVIIAIVGFKVAMIALNFVLYANPIVLITVAIIALIAVVKIIIDKMRDWAKSSSLLALPFKIIIGLIDKIGAAWNRISDAFSFGGMLEGIKEIGRTLIDFMLEPIQYLLEIVSNIPGLGDLAGDGALTIKNMRRSLGIDVGDDNRTKSERLDDGIAQLLRIDGTIDEKMKIFANRIKGLDMTDDHRTALMSEARTRLIAAEKLKKENENKRLAGENGDYIDTPLGGEGDTESTVDDIVTGGKKQFILNVQIDNVLGAVNQTVVNGEASANEVIDMVIDGLTRRLNGVYKSIDN